MLRILLCSELDLRGELRASVIGRQGIDVYRANGPEEARLLASSLGAQLILVDRDLPHAVSLIQKLREEPTTRTRSVAVLARGDLEPGEIELLAAGANAILRLPPDDTWPERLRRLLNVPLREEARVPVDLVVDMHARGPGSLVNLSVRGLLVETESPLPLHEELSFRFELPDGGWVEGRGRVVREAPPNGWGIEFVALSDAHRKAIQDYLRSARVG